MENETLVVTSFGPFDTFVHHGYENDDQISPIVPKSYTAVVSPGVVGMQFIGDRPRNLLSDKFLLRIKGPGHRGRAHALRHFSHGFLGYRLPRPLKPGRYRVEFITTDFNVDHPIWTILVRSPGRPRPLVTSRVSGQSLSALNTLRRTLGEPSVIWNTSLAAASVSHAQYLARHGYQDPSFHLEEPGQSGYRGVHPWNRDLYFGWQSRLSGEVGIEWSTPLPESSVIQDLVDTVYHRLSLLSDNLVSLGEGIGEGQTGAMVMDLGFGYRNRLPYAVVYPYAGQTGVPRDWMDIESPDPVTGGYGHIFGYPITVDFPTVADLSDVEVRLSQGLRNVPIVVDWPGNKDLTRNQIGVVPKKALSAGTIYQVSVTAEGRFNDGSRHPLSLAWRFETGGGSDSLSAMVLSPNKVSVAVMVSGDGMPEDDERVTLYRRGTHGNLKEVSREVTNQDGQVSFSRPRRRAGWYVAKTVLGNSVLFWWRSHAGINRR